MYLLHFFLIFDLIHFTSFYCSFHLYQHNIFFNHYNIENKLYTLKIINSKSCIVDLKCNYFLINQIKDFEQFVNSNNLNNKKINILMALIWINMAPLHTYPLNNFLLNFGKYNLFKFINCVFS